MFIKHTDEDITYTVLCALREMKTSGDNILSFEKGIYNFFPDYALEKVSCISNHDNDGFKKIGIPIIDFDGITVEGNGSEFVFNGIMVPFEITNSKNITLKNLSIDYPVTTYSHATVIDSGKDFLKLKIWENSPFEIENNRLKFDIPLTGKFEPWFFLDIDKATDTITEGSSRTEIKNMNASFEDDGTVLLTGRKISHVPKAGNTICMHLSWRYSPGFFINESKNIILSNVTVHHCLGMGVLCQLSENITLDELKVTPSSNRYASAYADATHFVSCRGDIVLKNCLLEKHFDDCLNCHGINLQIDKIIDRRTVLARLVHEQQIGVELLKSGENVELSSHTTLLPIAENKVESVEILSRNLMIITFENELDEKVNVKDVIESTDAAPNLTVTGCTMRKAFPRGLLITTRGKVLVENNYINTSCSAIHISGDANFWFESGCVRDVTIKNNTFYRCGAIRSNGKSKNYNVINIVPEISSPSAKDGYYHKNITVTDNKFITAHSGVLKAVSVENLIFKNNDIDIDNPETTIIECTGKIEL